MTDTSRRRGAPATSPEKLHEIADVIDAVCATRHTNPEACADSGPDCDRELRATLFALLDRPTQTVWEKVRELEVMPHYLTGLATPSPMGLTLADIVYLAGLSDLVCPSRNGLLMALRQAVAEHGEHRR